MLYSAAVAGLGVPSQVAAIASLHLAVTAAAVTQRLIGLLELEAPFSYKS
jgi:hypothetical protein